MIAGGENDRPREANPEGAASHPSGGAGDGAAGGAGEGPRVDEIAARWGRATPGPWEAGRFTAGDDVTLVVDGPTEALGEDAHVGPQICDNVFSEPDALAIAHAPEDIKRLLGIAEAVEKVLAWADDPEERRSVSLVAIEHVLRAALEDE